MSQTESHRKSQQECRFDREYSQDSDKHFRYQANWCDYHGVAQWLIPATHRTNPIKIGQQVTQEINELTEETETFTRSYIDIEDHPHWLIDPLLYCHRVTLFSEANKRNRYRNPNYKYYDERIIPIENKEKRIEFYEKYVKYGTMPPEWIAKHFGITSRSLCRFVKKYVDGPSPLQRLRDARRKIGRTTITLARWGYKQQEVADALGIPVSTLKYYVR